MRIYAALIGAIVAVAACDGGGGSTGTTSGSSTAASQEPAGSAGQEDAYCRAQASHETCNGGTANEPCREDAKCIYGRVMSRTAANAYFSCYSAPSCKSDDQCAAEAGQAVAGPAAETYTKDCTAKVEACPGTSNDFCSPAIFAYPDVRDAAQACMSKSCAELEPCLEAAVKPISDCK
jgi:hypothetical protein